jgi:hypothetical protein
MKAIHNLELRIQNEVRKKAIQYVADNYHCGVVNSPEWMIESYTFNKS